MDWNSSVVSDKKILVNWTCTSNKSHKKYSPGQDVKMYAWCATQ